jgi:hypothetical protein
VALETTRLAAARFPESGEVQLAMVRSLRDLNRRAEATEGNLVCVYSVVCTGVITMFAGMIIPDGKRAEYDCRHVAELPNDLFRNQAHAVPVRNPANGDPGAGNAWTSASNARVSRD